MIPGERPKLILGIDEDGKFKIDRLQAELLGLMESEQRWILTKPDQPSFQKLSADIIWLEFNEDRTYKARHKKPAVGLSLLMSPFNQYFTWQTTPITHIKEERENHWLFDTENSTYLLRKIEDDEWNNAVECVEAEESGV
jgi:hypothetical protein